MNAYELAYKLNNALGVDYEMLEQSSIMLRQQADRIERKQELIREQTALLVKQNNRIAELEKCLFQMQNACINLTQQSAEPFIWLKQDFDGEWIEVHPNKGIPLYTTPQIKEFTQAELKEIVENNTKYDYVDYFNLALDMNKAILKKANEK